MAEEKNALHIGDVFVILGYFAAVIATGIWMMAQRQYWRISLLVVLIVWSPALDVQARLRPRGDDRDKEMFAVKHVGPIDMGDDGKDMRLFDPKHGIKMGVKDESCDDGQTNIDTDWDGESQAVFTCYEGDYIDTAPGFEHIDEAIAGPSIHMCLDQKIEYDTPLPLSGPHRPLWPMFGEYKYLPPQRWVHSLEHGAVALLYQPCMDGTQILDDLKVLISGCLRKHVITPYRHIPGNKAFAVITYQHAILFSNFDIDSPHDVLYVTTFIKEFGLQAPEAQVSDDGQYSVGLKHKARIVSDLNDSNLCPGL